MPSEAGNYRLMEAEYTEIEPTPAPVRKYRVQLDFSQRDFDEINALVEELGLPTRAELFRSALSTLRWMVQKKRAACTILAITPEERFLEPEFDFLQGLAVAGSTTRSNPRQRNAQ